jgi:hypothetical protein
MSIGLVSVFYFGTMQRLSVSNMSLFIHTARLVTGLNFEVAGTLFRVNRRYNIHIHKFQSNSTESRDHRGGYVDIDMLPEVVT